MITPSVEERRKARTGFYPSFETMPPIVKRWAKANGFGKTIHGIVGPPETDCGGLFEAAVYDCLGREVRKAKRNAQTR